MEGEAVCGVNDDRHTGQPGRQAAYDTGLRGVSVDDRIQVLPQKSDKPPESGKIAGGTNLAADDVQVDNTNLPLPQFTLENGVRGQNLRLPTQIHRQAGELHNDDRSSSKLRVTDNMKHFHVYEWVIGD